MSSAKLHEVKTQWEVLVIDEAAQLKECESTIPLQLPGHRLAILIGDESQLPAMVKSKRLVLLGQKKELLNVQHRKHPSLSLFPNRVFYENQILDGPNVKERRQERIFLQGNMFGSYSFINLQAFSNNLFAQRRKLKLGGDEDVIIVSNGVVGFLKNHQRANVALIRARHSFGYWEMK
nr:putative atp-dependent helicase c29a10.10c [Quercus suber]